MRISIIFALLAVFAFVGCRSDANSTKEITTDDLLGKWEIFYATRNGNVTKSLENGNFLFQADNLVSSNLFNSPNSLNFTYDRGTIKIEGDSNVNSLKVKKLQNDTLIMTSKMKVFNMEFHLTKR